jgi:Xaa-Pro aminopeptidase
VALVAALGAALTTALQAQSDVAFSKDVYAARRARLVSELADGVIVVPGRYLISPGDELAKQDPTFWYLTGVESPYAILVLVPERGTAGSSTRLRWRSALFLPTAYQFAGGQFPMTDDAFRRAAWNRPRRRLVPGRDAQEAAGVDMTFPIDSFVPRVRELARGANVLYTTVESPLYAPPGLTAPLSLGSQFATAVAALFPGAEVRDVVPLVARLRTVKDAREIAALRVAAKIAGDGLIEAMRAVRPGVNDREIAGLMEYVWKREGSPRASFPPIVMSGPNAMTLFTLQRERYNAIDHVMRAGELVFIDYGAAEYLTYASDLCRTLPVSGTYTPQQRKYYDIVLEAQEAAIGAIRPGVMMVDVIKKAAEAFRKRGLEQYENVAKMGVDHVWGLMPSPTHYLARDGGITRYSASGMGVRDLGHMVGLEATDGRDWSRPLVAGMVVTVEPKIYIPDKQIAIMIEDEVLVTPGGHEVLSAHVPKRVEDVERVMAEGRKAKAWEKP